MSNVLPPRTVFSGATSNGQSVDTAMVACRGARKVAFRISAAIADAGQMIAAGSPTAQRYGQQADGSDAKTADVAAQLAPPGVETGLLDVPTDPATAGLWMVVLPRSAAAGDPGLVPDYVGITIATDPGAGAFTALKIEASVHY
jgi:hypothetical protein